MDQWHSTSHGDAGPCEGGTSPEDTERGRDDPFAPKRTPAAKHPGDEKIRPSIESDRRSTHLKRRLEAVRAIAKVMGRESEPHTLLDQVCLRLTDSEAYVDAWIALLDPHGGVEHLAVSPSLKGLRARLQNALRRDTIPYCARRALAVSAPVTVIDPGTDCGICPLSNRCPGLMRLSHGLAVADRVYGLISVAVPRDTAADEQAVFGELAQDLAFTLHKLNHRARVDGLTTRYRSLFENSHLPMLLIDPETGRIQDANVGAVAFYGWSRADLVGRPISTINTLTQAQIQAEMADALSRRRNHFRFRHRRADGSIRDVEVHSGPTDSADRSLLFSIIIDVTDQRHQHRPQEDTRTVFEDAQRIAQIGHYDFDIQADSWTSSPVLDDILGIDADYPRTTAGWLALVHPDDRRMMKAHLWAVVVRCNRPFDRTYRMRRHKDGDTRWVHGRGQVTLDEQNHPVRLLGTIQDVTEREHTYRRLSNTIRDLQLSQRIAQRGTWDYDPVQEIAHLSSQIWRLLGMPMVPESLATESLVPGPWAKRTALPVLRSGNREIPSHAIATSGRDGTDLGQVNPFPTEGQGRRWLHIIGQPPEHHHGPEGTSMRGGVQGITALDRARLTFTPAKDGAVTASRAKSAFLANVSHEIRTPLNAIIGFAETMAQEVFGPIQNPAYKTYSQDILRAGQNLLGLINDIIDLSRIEVDDLDLSERWLDVGSLLQSVLRLFAMQAQAKDITLKLTVPERLPALYGDDLRVRQILSNLLSNALKFTPDGGFVTVAPSVDKAGRLGIAVADTGIGIAPDQLNDVLSVFGRAANAYVSGQDGAGLGLPLSARLAELHGGTLAIDSEPGHGTTVTILFPADRTATPEPTTTD